MAEENELVLHSFTNTKLYILQNITFLIIEIQNNNNKIILSARVFISKKPIKAK